MSTRERKPLTPPEHEVLNLVCEGRENTEISRELHMGYGTVKEHIRHILVKLGAKNRTHAVAIYLRRDE